MDRPAPRRRTLLALAPALAAAAALWAGALPAALAAPAARHGGPAPATAAPRLPSDFPAAVPLPPGRLQGSTGAAGQWSVMLLVRASAARTHRSAFRFYRAHGFRARTDSILRKGAYTVTLVVENRDHSAAKTFLVVGVTRRAR